MTARSSQLKSFYKLRIGERLEFVKMYAGLTEEEAALLQKQGGLRLEQANRMIENVIGFMPIPLGVAVNFLINGKDYLIPMAIEEPSVVAASSNAAKIVRQTGGFTATTTDPVMIGQIQIVGVSDPYKARVAILEQTPTILAAANAKDPVLVKLGGGAKGVRARVLQSHVGTMVVAELLVDCRDVMGANAVNTMCEAVAPLIEDITGGRAVLRIISNLATERLARARCTVSKKVLGGEDVVDAIIQAYALAAVDPYRCATHNKGIMNGIVAVALATCNDTRALEAGAHSYAARSGRYTPLTVWEKDSHGDLVGSIELPAAIGIIGGVTASHPLAKICLKILGVKSAVELGGVLAAVGLAQNFAALRVLATEGLQRGHMALHARNVAIMAGAEGELVDKVAEVMVSERRIRVDRAKEILDQLKAA